MKPAQAITAALQERRRCNLQRLARALAPANCLLLDYSLSLQKHRPSDAELGDLYWAEAWFARFVGGWPPVAPPVP